MVAGAVLLVLAVSFLKINKATAAAFRAALR